MDGDATATCSSADREGQGRRGRGAAVVAAGRRDIQREHLHGHAPPRTPRGKPPTNQPMTFSASAAMDRCGLGQELKLAGPDGPCARACRSPSMSTSRTARACSAPCSPTRAGASGSATYVLTTSSRARSCRFLQLARRNLSILGYCAGGMAGPHAAAAVPPPHRAPRRRHAAAAPRRRARPPSRAYSLTGHVFPSFPSCTGTCNYER